MTQSCWTILGIEPTHDQRAIKRAYAALLKTTRPEQDAAAFQRLYGAYQRALDSAEDGDFDDAPLGGGRVAEAVGVGSDVDTIAVSSGHVSDGFDFEDGAPNGLWSEEDREQLDAILERARGLLSTYAGLREPHSWDFLFEHELIRSTWFRESLGIALLKEFAAHNRRRVAENFPWKQVTNEVVAYLGQVFHWQARPYFVADLLGEEDFQEIEPLLHLGFDSYRNIAVLGASPFAVYADSSPRAYRPPWWWRLLDVKIVLPWYAQAAIGVLIIGLALYVIDRRSPGPLPPYQTDYRFEDQVFRPDSFN